MHKIIQIEYKMRKRSDGLACVFLKLLISWDFHTYKFGQFTQNDTENKKHPISVSSAGIIKRVIDERGQRTTVRLVIANRKANRNKNHSLQLWLAEKHLRTHNVPSIENTLGSSLVSQDHESEVHRLTLNWTTEDSKKY